MIRAKIQKDGYLKITADNEGRWDLKEAYTSKYGGGYQKAEGEVIDALHDQFHFILPEWVGALTDAPILADDLTIEDNGDISFVGDTWWFPDYQVTDPWEVLKNTGRVIFDPEENNKSLPKNPKRS